MSNHALSDLSIKTKIRKRSFIQHQPMAAVNHNSIEKIYASTLKLLRPRTPKELYKTSIIEAANLVGVDSGSLFLEENGKLKRVYSNVPHHLRMEPRVDGNAYRVFKSQIPRSLSFSRLKQAHPEVANAIGSIILIPLTYADIKLGVISLTSTQNKPLSEPNRQNLKLFGSLISLAIHNLQLYRQKHQALKSRELFMSMASHELKNPLTSINSYAQLIKRAIEFEKPIEAKWVDTVLSNVKKLHTIIEDLLHVTEITRGGFSISSKEVDMFELIKSTVAQFQLTHAHRVVVDSQLKANTCQISTDPPKLSMVLANILNNAAKYSPPTSTITITLSRAKGKLLKISIADQGIGISKNDLDQVFDRFFQGKHSTQGMGLGLFICREIVTALGGSIAIDSKPKQGTTVDILLP